MLHSIYDLTTVCRKTTGDVPEKLVGASTTVVGSKMYLFGGRLVTERRMVSDLYVFDLETLVWEKLPPHVGDDVPRARYFHSADHWNNRLIIFGGMSTQPDASSPEELSVLNDVRMFDIAAGRWLPAKPVASSDSDSSLVPRARYAHLSSVTSNQLFIIGGQDFYNTWLDDVCAFNLSTGTWVQRREYPRHCGTYRSVAVSSDQVVRLPQEQPMAFGAAGPTFHTESVSDKPSSSSLTHLPYSSRPTDEHPAEIFLYSNYNFTEVKRELEVFSPLQDGNFSIEDRSTTMNGTTLPPGLRFPSGAILGHHLIIAGTYLAHSYQSFSIWVLDLISMTWSRIDPGKAVEAGSWFRSCLYADANRLMVFGNKEGNLVEDYNRRLLSWDHVAVVDLEAFGIYQPPPQLQDIPSQALGLAALDQKVLADFDVVCEDGRKVSCSRKILEERWPWFREEREKMSRTALLTMADLPESPMHIELPELPGSLPGGRKRPDPRLTSRSMIISEPYPIVLALLQYFYTQSIATPLQHAPAVLSQLLILAATYGITDLQTMVKHAMHRALSNATSVGVYEVATLCSCRSLQIRALKTVMAYTQKKPSKGKDNGNRSDGASGGSGGGGGGGAYNDRRGVPPGPSDAHLSRPRGTSDAQWRTNAAMGAGHNKSSYNSRPAALQLAPRSIQVEDPEPSPFGDRPGQLPMFSSPRNQPQHHRQTSAVSVTTDDDLCAVAELMMPLVHSPSDRPTHDRARSEDITDLILDKSYQPSSSQHPYATSDVPKDVDADLHSMAPSRSGYNGTYSDGDSDEYDVQSVLESGYSRSRRVSLPSFDLPRRSTNITPDTLSPITHQFSDISDTPSLMSSRGSSRGSMISQFTPLTPSTAQFSFPSGSDHGHPLEVIEERFQEDHVTPLPHTSDLGIDVVSRSSPSKGKYATLPPSPTVIITPSAPTSVRKAPPAKLSLATPFRSTSMDTLTPKSATMLLIPGTPNSAFSRFFGGSSKKDVSQMDTISVSSPSTGSSDKSFKAELKKAKKEEQKAKREQLAMRLKESSKQRAVAEDKLSLKSQEKKKKEPVVSMYGNVDGMFTM